MKNTTYFNFNKPELTDVVNPEDFNDNSDKLDKILYNSTRLEVAGGTANALTLTEVILEDKTIKNFIAKFNNDASVATTINGKNTYRAGTTESPTFISGKAYCVWYDESGDCFFTRANAEGDVEASQVLAGKYFSNDKDTRILGTMPNNPAINSAINCGESVIIPEGYTPGGTVKANSLASQTSATATANKVLNGYTFWKDGVRYTGNIPLLQAQTITPGTSNKTINPGTYINGPQTIKGDPNLIASNIISGKSIFGIVGNASIQSLGGIKYAIGSVTCKKSSESFSKQGGEPYIQPIAEITGLPFIPKWGFAFVHNGVSSAVSIFDGSIFFSRTSNAFSYSLSDYNNGTYLIGYNYIRFPMDTTENLNKTCNYYLFG